MEKVHLFIATEESPEEPPAFMKTMTTRASFHFAVNFYIRQPEQLRLYFYHGDALQSMTKAASIANGKLTVFCTCADCEHLGDLTTERYGTTRVSFAYKRLVKHPKED